MEKQSNPQIETAAPTSKKTILLSIFLIITLSFTVYGNSLNGEFVWDDEGLVEDNRHIKNWTHLPQIFTEDIGAGFDRDWNFYRPLQMITYMADYSLWELNPKGYHLTNILLHIAAALGVYWLINIIFKNNRLSLLTGIFFAIHPIHTEAVSYISGRADSLALLFMLLCFICYIKSPPSKQGGLYLLMVLSYVLALLSRENSLILPVLILLYNYSFKKKLHVKAFFSLTVLAAVYVLLRVTVLKAILTPVTFSTTLLQRLPGFFVAITTYTRLLFLPINLHMEYGAKVFPWSDPRAILGVALLAALLIYALRKKRKNPLVFFALSWFVIALLPVSNLYPINAYMAEHWLYLPSVGFFLLIAQIISSLYTTKHFRMVAAVCFLSVLGFYSYLTVRQNTYWKEPIRLYTRTLNYAPESPGVYNNLGYEYNAINRREEAIASYKKALKINPGHVQTLFNLGIAYQEMHRYAEAVTSYKRALEIKPDYVKVHINLGNVYNAIHKYEEAIASYKKALEIEPNYAEVYNNLGNVYSVLNRSEEAITAYKKAIKINPKYLGAYNNLGGLYDILNKKDESIILYKQAIAIDPKFAATHNNLAIVYYHSEQYELAIEYCDKAGALGYTNSALLEALKPYR